MIKLNQQYAIQEALEITKILCANPGLKIQLNKDSAKDLADFICTLEASLTNQED